MQPIINWFLQPYPFEARWLSGLRNGFWAGLFVTFFLFFFKPFGTNVTPGSEMKYLAVCGGYGLVTLLITLLVNGFCLFLPKIFNEENWVVWKEVLFNLFFIFCIGLGNLLLANTLWDVPFNGRTFWVWQGLTFAVGIFPTFFGAFLNQTKWSQKYAAEAAKLHLPTVHPTLAASVTFMGENQNEAITLQADQVAYLVAQDNYVQVFFFEQSVLKSKMLRATLRKMEETLADWPQFFRCHRTFLVNFDKIEKVSGNAQGYRLHLSGVEETIPVSRNLNEVVRARLTEII
jgi:hypothetical protein